MKTLFLILFVQVALAQEQVTVIKGSRTYHTSDTCSKIVFSSSYIFNVRSKQITIYEAENRNYLPCERCYVLQQCRYETKKEKRCKRWRRGLFCAEHLSIPDLKITIK